MAKCQINILGCGSATPTLRHNPSCQVIDFRDRLFMIDCGEGAQVEMRRMKLSYQRLSHIFISHLHGDHCFGLPGLLCTMGLHQKGGKVTVCMPQQGLELFRSFVNYFCKETPFDIEFIAVPKEGGIVYEDHALTVEAFPLYHRVPCYGYIFREKPKLRHINGETAKFYQVPVYLMNDIRNGADFVTPSGEVIPNKLLTTDADAAISYAYCSDTVFDHRVAESVRGVDVIYHETTYADDNIDKALERGHSTARQAAIIAREAGARELIIGHYSKRYNDVEVMLREAKEEFDCVIAADEGMKIDLL